MRPVTATRPNVAAAPTISGSLLRERGKICILGVGEPTGALSGAAGGLADAALTRSKSGPLGALIRNRALSDNRMFCERSARESPHAQEGYSRLGSDT